MFTVQREDWVRHAACADMEKDVFYPGQMRPEPKRRATALALLTCSRCVVRAECLAYAVRNEETYGIWGGKTERQRRLLIRRTDDIARLATLGATA